MIVKIEKLNFHRYKSPIFSEADIDNVLVVSNKISFGKKNFKYFMATCMMVMKLSHYI